MNVTEHQRPGVYSVYDASTVISGKRGGGAVGLIAMCSVETVERGTVCPVSGYEQAAALFGEEMNMTKLIKILFQNGAGTVYAVPVSGSDGYDLALAALEQLDGIDVLACDSLSPTIQLKLKESVAACAQLRRERIAVLAGPNGTDPAAMVERAATFNSERVVLVSPGGVEAAAAVAGAIAGESDPAMPLGGVELTGVPALSLAWTDNQIDTLVLGGVTPLESVDGTISVVRAVTTRTTTGSAADATWRELTTIRIVDDVIPGLRRALRARFSRAKNTAQGREAIRSQVVVELEQKVREEVITGYDQVSVSALENDPTVCLVEFTFAVAHGLNQIWLSAHITV